MTEAEVASQFTVMRVDALKPSPDNPRKKFDPDGMKELTANIKANGIIEPIVVRPITLVAAGEISTHEIVAGERRWRAAQAAKLQEVPVRIMQLSDNAALEIMLSENLQRRNIHPLEEAQGLRKLISQSPGLDIEDLAARLGVTARYIYDRERLLKLSPPARKLFLADAFPLRHAILLARLSDTDQSRALDVDKGGMFSRQRLLTAPGEPVEESLKHNSLDELKSWIDLNVRLDPMAKETAELFPETHHAIERAVEKVVHITHLAQVTPEVLAEGKILGPKTWKRADPVCPHAAIGVVVIGPHLGDSFRVCYNRKACAIHWAAEQREARLKAAERGQPETAAPVSFPESPTPASTEESAANVRKEAAEREARFQTLVDECATAKEVLAIVGDKLTKRTTDVRPILAEIVHAHGNTLEAMQYIGGFPAHSRKALDKLRVQDLVHVLLVATLIDDCGELDPGMDSMKTAGLSDVLLAVASTLSVDVKKVRRGVVGERLKQGALSEQAKKVDALPAPKVAAQPAAKKAAPKKPSTKKGKASK